MDSWGILGKPTKKEIEEWKNMPHGKFSKMVKDLKKISNGKPAKKFTVRITETVPHQRTYDLSVRAYSHNHAISLAKEKINIDEVEWSKRTKGSVNYSYTSYANQPW